jgi:RimJ/RimL family protein N-acetyltransferase
MTRVEGRTYRGEVLVLRDEIEGEPKQQEGNDFADWGQNFVRPGFEIHRLVIAIGEDDLVVGSVSWHEVWYGPTTGSRAWNIGIGLAPIARGRGVGSMAQRLIAEHLFATTDINRVEASTDVTNEPEQRALERAGFTREGVIRKAQQRADGHHDLYAYSILRSDFE